MKEKLLHRPLLFSMVFSAGWLFLYFLFFQSTFETNDDAYMMLFSSGLYTGKPMEYILPSGVFLGWTLKSLYEIAPMGNWYTLYLLFVHFISLTSLNYVALTSSKKITIWLGYALSLIFFESYFLVYLQFTTGAFLLSIAGFLLFVQLIQSNKKGAWVYLAPLIMLIVASQIREKVPLLILMVGSPVLGYSAIFQDKFRSVAVFSGCFLMLFLASQWSENNYQGPIKDWGKHKALFETGFYPVYNYPIQQSIGDEPIFKSLGWSKNDFHMFKSGFFERLPKYSMENLQVLSNHFSAQKQGKEKTAAVLLHFFSQYKYLFILTLLCLFLSFLSKNIPAVIITATITFISIAIWFYIGQDLILKARVIIPMLFFIQLYSMYSFSNSYDKIVLPNLRWIEQITIPILCLLILLGIGKIYLNDKKNVRPAIQNYENQYTWLEKNFPDEVKVVWGTSLSVDHIDVLSNFYSNKKKAKLYLLLANLGYWQNPELLKVYNENDVYLALLNNPKFVLLLADYKIPHLHYLSQFYKENYQIDVRARQISSYSDPRTGRKDFHIYKIVRYESR